VRDLTELVEILRVCQERHTFGDDEEGWSLKLLQTESDMEVLAKKKHTRDGCWHDTSLKTNRRTKNTETIWEVLE